MEFKWNDEQQLMQTMFREFVDKELRPIAAELDEQERFPFELIPKMGEIGLLGIPVAEEFGGVGMGTLEYVMAVEEISKACASTGVTISAHTSLCCWPIEHFGTQEQKEKYLPDLATGEKLGAFGLTEPNAGTDAAMQRTTAEDKGDHWLLNGSKVFITNGEVADVYVVFAMTDKAAGNKGISAFLLEKGMEGFSFGSHEKKMGIRASSTCELVFEDVKVPKENLLGELNKGFQIAMMTLDGGRIGIAAQALGIAQGAIDETVKYVKDRVQFGRPISKFQNTQFMLAEMQTRVDAARMLVYRAAAIKDAGEPYSSEAAMAKLFASETAREVTWRAVQLFGGYGYTRDYPVERMMRDAKITEIYEGTSEVQKMVISSRMGL
ncbi:MULTISPECIES: acyl-CoA dehydrogenase [Intestinimonas]|uniref:Acyl-CoA dehydrogenase n=1 Tax=Intestinimonas massiliensis (ex Afouda et al. 2020) TaxID=1673721 RepID=A0AAW5JU49_9FIRM|nr:MULTISPECIES: acyl-CoA dehydrogenase [Intestinimonas]MBS6281771.1 acyl-CoA dehydrogenase [Oscillospiraceae bacterium]MDU1324966.1 acyl-CoA dehydrogenase [Clostridiales bacterium]CUP63859.1 acyl-CoA dehydrogenase [Flavonifractor plautii]SCI70279.1 Acyl-CoA dehydrogenase%2C short-chain specific [uncultured Flavonifractor sp.]MCG4528828.1 acyl-CoA dehydrogenase [Intestinimonas massiliensis (ex Afouda et al. 2020)]